MIRDRLIVCIASSWDYDPTSKHHLMRILSRENQILWVNYHGTRRPSMTRWDVRDSISASLRIARGLCRISESISQFTPLVIPGATGAVLGRVHQRMLIDQIDRAVSVLDPGRQRPIQVWTFAPDVHFLRGALSEERFVYYCVDEYTRFQGFDSEAMTRLETKLLHCSDLVIATSKPLWEAKKELRPDAEFVPHGVDYDHFAAAWRESLAAPVDLQGIRRPIFGFFGLIQHWFDVELLAGVARLRPEYAFVLIGDCKIEPGKLKLPNVHLLGRRDYSLLPAYSAAFSVGLLPFVRNAMTHCINPIKLSEYLAAGLPVVSTSLPASRDFGGAVAIADTAEDFAAACDASLRYTAADRQRISQTVQPHTWEDRVKTVSRLVLESVRRVPRPEMHPQPVNAAVSGGYRKPFERVLSYPAN